MPCFYSELWSVTSSLKSIQIQFLDLKNCSNLTNNKLTLINMRMKWRLRRHSPNQPGQQVVSKALIKTILTLKISEYFCKSGSSSFQRQPVVACSYCHRLWNSLCLCFPVWSTVQECSPKSSAFDFASIFDHFLESLLGVIARWQAGPRTWTQNWSLLPDQQVVKVYQLWNPWINCVEFKFCIGLLKMQNWGKQSNYFKAQVRGWLSVAETRKLASESFSSAGMWQLPQELF